MSEKGAGSDRRLVLWRHGRTAWNVVNRCQGQLDVEMDVVGQAQARRAAARLVAYEPVALWSSDLSRALGTAAELAALTGLEVRRDPRLREYHAGIRQGLTFDEFREQHPVEHELFFGVPDHRVPDAEEPAEVRERVATALREITATLPAGGTAVVVSHGAAITAGLLGFFGIPVGMRDLFAGMDNCAWAVLHEHPARGWQLVRYNSHEPPGNDSMTGQADALPAGPEHN